MLTNAELAILSLIAEKPCHGYQIEQLIEERAMRRWTEIGFSSIYRILKKLEQEGMISGSPGKQQGRGPARVIYKITEAGWNAWREASLEALSTPSMTNSSFLLGLDNLYELDPQQAMAALSLYTQRLVISRDSLKRHVEQQSPTHFYMAAFFDYMITMFSAEIQWLEHFIVEMEKLNSEKEHE